jgi:RNA polymerase sigma-70 factor (ECF subfamily)
MSTEPAEERFHDVYRAYHRRVLAYFLRRIDGPSALDGAAETFLIAWRRIEEMPHGDTTLPWLYGVSRKVLANQYRSKRRRQSLSTKLRGAGQQNEPNPETITVRQAEDEALLKAVHRLRSVDQEVLQLAIWEELPHAQIGEILGTSAHAVTQRLQRITKTLARDLQVGLIKTRSRGGQETTEESDRGNQ